MKKISIEKYKYNQIQLRLYSYKNKYIPTFGNSYKQVQDIKTNKK